MSLLEAAENLSKLPEAEEAFRAGELSASQAKEVAGATIMDPSATKTLLDTARSEGFEDLRRRCNQVKAAKISKEDEDAQTRRSTPQGDFGPGQNKTVPFAWMPGSPSTPGRSFWQGSRQKPTRPSKMHAAQVLVSRRRPISPTPS